VIKREVTGENDKTTHPSTPKTMANIPQGALFSWNEIEAASDLQRLLLVLRVLPDEKRVRALDAVAVTAATTTQSVLASTL
jgi:hypothetical protein